jgi:tRNA G18 (ribose-2'-O)-methylase SpoU
MQSMTAIPIDDPDDPRVALYRNLTDAELRRATESAHGVFVAEGKFVVSRLARSTLAIRSILIAENRVEAVTEILGPIEAPLYVAPSELLATITGFDVHRGVLAIGERPSPSSIDELRATARAVAIIEDLTDHENLGAIARSAYAFGIDALVLSPGAGDPYSRRAVRVSMGAVFDLPIYRAPTWPGTLDDLRHDGFVLWAMTPRGDTALERISVPERVALLFGTEGAGLSDAAIAHCNARVAIAIREASDSLNVAAAAAIAFHHIKRV